MNSPEISVIVPVYNTEPYVREAVCSVLQQSFRDIEVILIDDGSTDGSLAVLRQLAAEDDRIVLLTQPNAGLAATRNVGLEKARGCYVYFMDSDDWLESDALACCHALCEAHDLDFALFDAESFGAAEAAEPWFDYRRAGCFPGIHTGRELFLKQLEVSRYRSSVCLNLIRRELLDRTGLRFYAGIIHEDELFTATLYLEADRVEGIARSFFHRRVREASIMTSRFSERNVEGYLTVIRELHSRTARRDRSHRLPVRLLTRKILSVAMRRSWQLPAPVRRRLAATALCRYPHCVDLKALAALLLKRTFKRRSGK